MLFLLMATGILFLILLLRLSRLMLAVRPDQAQRILTTRRFFEILPAKRGNIYDFHGIPLAISTPIVELGIDPQIFRPAENDPTLQKIAQILKTTPEKWTQHLQNQGEKHPRGRWIKLEDGISENSYERIQNLHCAGIYGNRKFRRQYPQNRTAAHITGFINRENRACCGVEKFLDFFLRGQDGWIISEKDGRRRELRQYRARDIKPQSGYDVYLTIDANIQQLIEGELERIQEEFHPDFATILVSEANSGKILALGCIPNYDPNRYFQFPMDHLRNRAVTDIYEPGSVFKIVAASAGLEERVINRNSHFDCTQSKFEFSGKIYSLPNDYSEFGQMTLVDVLRKSSNRGSAQIAILLGEERFYNYVRAFGFGEKTGYGFDGEVSGILHPPHLWDSLTITRMPMGHAIGVTPLQMHMAMGVLAADGYLLGPRIVEKIISNGDEIDLKTIFAEPSYRRKILRKSTVLQMRAMLAKPEDVIANHWPLVCKTGTSQKIINGHYVRNRHTASCSGFFPAAKPQFVISVVVDSPQTPDQSTAWGSRYAKPSLKRIAEQLALSGNHFPANGEFH